MELFIASIRKALQKVPIENRRTWETRDLSWWWNDVLLSDSQLKNNHNLAAVSFDALKRACEDLIGEKASS